MPSPESEDTRLGGSSAEVGLGRCLVEGDPDSASPGRRSRRKAFGASLVIESFFVVLLVVTPLLTGVAQPQIHRLLPPDLTFFGPWHEHSPVRQVVVSTGAHLPALPNPLLHFAPPRPIFDAGPTEGPGDAPSVGLPGISGTGTNPLGEVATSPRPAEPPHFVPPPQEEKRPVKLSAGVVAAQLISRVEPRYPYLAVETRQSGIVVLHAIISRDGGIESLEVVSGSPFFVQAALDAVRQWRYRPTLLDGEPVEVETTITVEFRLRH